MRLTHDGRIAARSTVAALVLLGALVLGAGPAGASAGVSAITPHAHSTPKVGGPKSKFTISFTTPITTGTQGASVIYEVIQGATDNLRTINKGGCISTFAIAASYAAAGSHISGAVLPSTHWCAGIYRGQIVELKVPACSIEKTCASSSPVELGEFGHYKFKVT